MKQGVTGAKVQLMPIDSISIGKRRRKKFGNIKALARSIELHGLVHPLLVRNGGELVSGHRRLKACQQLGWREIPVRRVEAMADDELRAIELDENAQRLSLSDFESSKVRLGQIREAEAVLKAEAVSKPSLETSKGGRPPKGAVSKKAIGKAIGISETTIANIERHVALAERYPFFQRSDWVQHQVLEAGKEIEALPRKDQSRLAAMLDQPGVPPKDAIRILKNMRTKEQPEREEIFKEAESEDEMTRRTAMTRAINTPDPLDPAHNLVMDAARTLKKAVHAARSDEVRGIVETVHQYVVDADEQLTALYRRNRKWEGSQN
jgi:hypothetical protein